MGILVHGIDIFIPEMVYINTVASETRLFKNIIQRTLESCIYKQQENTYSSPIQKLKPLQVASKKVLFPG